MSTGEKFGIGSSEAPFENVSTKVLSAFRDGGNDLTYVILSLAEFINEFNSPSLKARLARAHINVDNTVNLLKTDGLGDQVLPTLIMTMKPCVMQSLLLGTVARDATVDHGREWPISTGPGVYAVGIAVDGRNGGFLNSVELETVADRCDKYVQAFHISQMVQQPSPQQQEVVRAARAIDCHVAFFTSPGFRSVTCPDDADRVTLFAERLRVRAAKARQVDPSGTTILYQSPLYIGCATNIDQRIKLYSNERDNDKPSFRDINKLLGLTVNILSDMGLPSKLKARSVMPIWELRHMDIAERLVTTMASALVAQDGFNATEAGGHKGNASSEVLQAQYEWIHTSDWVEHNIDQVLQSLETSRENRRKIAELNQNLIDLQAELNFFLPRFADKSARAESLMAQLPTPEERQIITDEIDRRMRVQGTIIELLSVLEQAADDMGLPK